MNEITTAIRRAARNLARTPRFTIVAIACLAAGVAVAAAALAVADAYLVRSLPYPGADRIYHVVYAQPGRPEPRGMTALDWTALDDVVEVADGSSRTRFYLTDGSYAQEAGGLSVARGAEVMLGVQAALGRSFVDADFGAGSEPVALIGDSLWRDRFQAAPGAVGSVLRANLNDQADAAQTFRIVGVLPPDFRYAADLARDIEIVIPQRFASRVYTVRLREDVPAPFAERRITEAAKRVAQAVDADWSVRLESVRERYVAGVRPLLLAVTAAAGLLLVVVCLNVAVLMMLRVARRGRDVAVQVALGASRLAVLRVVAAESALICAAAVVLGLAIGAVALRLFEPSVEQHLGRPAPGATAAIGLAPSVLLAVAGIGVLAALLLFTVPTFASWPRRLADALRRDGRSATGGRGARRVRSALIALEIGGSVALLVACGLMVRSAVNLLDTDLGFSTQGVVRARLALPQRDYPDAAALAAFHERFLDKLAADTGAPLALTNFPPYYDPPRQAVQLDRVETAAREAAVIAVTADYFSILDVPVVQGRALTANDRIGAEPVALVSESLARGLSPGGDAIGMRIRTGEQPAARSPLGEWRTIVGVVKDLRQHYTDADSNDVYLPFLQTPNQYAPLFVRTDRPAAAWLPILRTAASELDPAALITGVTSLAAEGDRLSAPARFLALCLSVFALLALLVALIGIYGVTAYAVHQREREAAIRIAVGASETAVVRMFLKEGSVVLAAGVAIGLLGAFAAGRLVAAQLYEVGSFDAGTLVAACAAVAAAGAAATWLAAKRAATTNPVAALTES